MISKLILYIEDKKGLFFSLLFSLLATEKLVTSSGEMGGNYKQDGFGQLPNLIFYKNLLINILCFFGTQNGTHFLIKLVPTTTLGICERGFIGIPCSNHLGNQFIFFVTTGQDL